MCTIQHKNEFEEYFSVSMLLSSITWRDEPLSTHYHFKRRKDMRRAMRINYNPFDTFTYEGKDVKKSDLPLIIESLKKLSVCLLLLQKVGGVDDRKQIFNGCGSD